MGLLPALSGSPRSLRTERRGEERERGLGGMEEEIDISTMGRDGMGSDGGGERARRESMSN